MSDAVKQIDDEPDDLEMLESLGQEFLDRQRRGESVTVEQYAKSHPKLAERIRHLFPAMEAMERFKSCSATSSNGTVNLQLEPFEQLGDFRILREIGRGGMGVVYEAEQQSLQRRVAVKVLPRKTLSDSKQLSRFHREARTAARLHHTNIVPVFGVGEQDAMHYFVMQRIDGTPLDEIIQKQKAASRMVTSSADPDESAVAVGACDDTLDSVGDTERVVINDNGPATNDRHSIATTGRVTNLGWRGRSHWRSIADIGIQIADALDYAHSQGVLHRDIKPSNLLLDPNGRVWVTDFGLATVLASEAFENSGEVAGTLRYMAPEHLGGEHDARSDLYSLGLTLYEMLTLKPAFEDASRSALVSKIMKGTLERPREIRREIPRDLEAIVMKAIAVERDQRYENAHAMARDLRRFVESRTVSARRVGPISKLNRWARRNPAVASLTAAMLLMAGLSFALVSAKWRDAVDESRRAGSNLSLALESMDQMLARFGSSWMAQPIAATGDEVEEQETGIEFHMAVSDYNASVLQEALQFYDKFARQNPTNPKLQRDTAKVHRRVADIYLRLGQFGKAEDAYRRSLVLLDPEQMTGETGVAIETASTLNQLGLAMFGASRFEEAEVEFRRAQRLLAHPRYKDDPESQAEQARILTSLGKTQWLMFRRDEATRSQQSAVELLEKVVRQHPENSAYRLALALAYRSYYQLVAFGDREGKSEQVRQSSIEILEKLVLDFPNVPDFRCELAETLAASFTPRYKTDESQRIDDLQRSIELTRELTTSHPSIPRYRAALARSLKELAVVYGKSQQENAQDLFAESVTLYRSLVQDFANVPVYHLYLTWSLGDHAEHFRRLGMDSDARDAIAEAIKEQREYLRLRPGDNRFGMMMLSRLYKDLAETLRALGLNEDADRAMQQYESSRPPRREHSHRRGR